MEFFGKKRVSKGGILVSSTITYDPPQYIENKNTFVDSDFNESILEHCHLLWGLQNKGAQRGDLGNGFYQYPISPQELSTTQINGIDWCKVKAESKGEPPELCYFSPLTSRHTLFFLFEIDTYRGLDFFSEETNLKDTAYSVIDDFMSHVFIEHSEQAKAELGASRPNNK